MAIRTDFTAGEVLAAADLNDTFAAKLNLAGGKILQIVRATDATERTTTSTSFVDASLSVTITPQKSDSAILIISSSVADMRNSTTNTFVGHFQITDNSNNAISGAQGNSFGVFNMSSPGRPAGPIMSSILIAYATPATTSAVTYKTRFRSNDGGGVTIKNTETTGQMYAIEVSA